MFGIREFIKEQKEGLKVVLLAAVLAVLVMPINFMWNENKEEKREQYIEKEFSNPENKRNLFIDGEYITDVSVIKENGSTYYMAGKNDTYHEIFRSGNLLHKTFDGKEEKFSNWRISLKDDVVQ